MKGGKAYENQKAGIFNCAGALSCDGTVPASKSATYKLTANISGTKKQITVKSGTKTLDLNAHTIKGSSTSLIYVNGGSLTVKSSASGGKLYNTNSSGDAAGCAGGSDYEAHMWNVIKLKSGSRYYVDVTFDEGASSGSKVSTKFFYRSESRFYGIKYHIAY